MKGIREYRGKTLISYEYTLDLGRDPVTGRRKQKWYGGFSTAEEAAAHRALNISTRDQQKALARFQATIPGLSGIAVPTAPAMPTTPALVEVRTVADFLSERETDYVAHNVEVTTAENYHNDVQYYINPWLGTYYLHDLQPLTLQRWITSLLEKGRKDGKGLAPVTVDHAFRTLKTALNYAKDMKMITENPAEGVRPPRVEVVKQDGVPIEDIQKICDEAWGTRWHTPIVLSANTGIRRSEAMGMIWQRVDFEAKTLTVESVLVATKKGPKEKPKPKSRAGNRVVTLDQMTLDELWKHRESEKKKFHALGKRWSNKELVFTNNKGTKYDPRQFSTEVKRIMRKAGYPDLHLNDLRHAHISNLLSAGVPVLLVAERAGHSDPTMTLNVYGHVIPSDRTKFADIDQALVNPDS